MVIAQKPITNSISDCVSSLWQRKAAGSVAPTNSLPHYGNNLKFAAVDSIGQRNSYVKTWGLRRFLNETNIYSRGKSLCF